MDNELIITWRRTCLFIPFMRPLLGMPIELVLIRHAESERNAALKGTLFLENEIDAPENLKAVGDTPDHRVKLTDLGHRQAKATGARILQYVGKPDIAIHSGYTRTIQTMEGLIEGISGAADIKVREDLSLRERKTGYTYSMTKEEVLKNFPFNDQYWKVTGSVLSRPQGGESLWELIENRLRWVVAKVWKRYAGKKVWFVTHGRVIQCLRAMLDDMSVKRMEDFVDTPGSTPKNASITVYRYDPKVGKLTLREYSTVLHEETL